MIVTLYPRLAARDLVAALAAESTVVATDGRWQPGDWQRDLGAAATTGRPLAALGVRAAPSDPVLPSRDWAHAARQFVRHSPWQGAPWVAVRTDVRSMVVLAETDHQPDPATLQRAADMIRRSLDLVGPRAALAGHAVHGGLIEPAPMQILDARLDLGDRLAVLVDRIPDLAELRFTAYPVPDDRPWRRHPGPDTLYVAVHPDGYVKFLLDNGDGLGFDGEPFDLRLTDGASRTVVGPYSSSTETVAAYAPSADVYRGEVAFTDNRRRWADNVNGGGLAGHLTQAAAQQAMRLAGWPSGTHPAALAQAFDPPAGAAPAAPAPNPGSRASAGRAGLHGSGHRPPAGPPSPHR